MSPTSLSPDALGIAGPLGERATLLQLSSGFCAPCRAARGLLARVAETAPGVRHVDIDVAHHPELAARLTITRPRPSCSSARTAPSSPGTTASPGWRPCASCSTGSRPRPAEAASVVGHADAHPLRAAEQRGDPDGLLLQQIVRRRTGLREPADRDAVVPCPPGPRDDPAGDDDVRPAGDHGAPGRWDHARVCGAGPERPRVVPGQEPDGAGRRGGAQVLLVRPQDEVRLAVDVHGGDVLESGEPRAQTTAGHTEPLAEPVLQAVGPRRAVGVEVGTQRTWPDVVEVAEAGPARVGLQRGEGAATVPHGAEGEDPMTGEGSVPGVEG